MPFPLVALLISAAFTIAGALLAPRPKNKAKTQDELNVPTATEDRPKPLFVGTIRHKSPNCIWYGDYSTKAIKKPGSLYFNKITVGFRYFIGIDIDLGWGAVDSFRTIWLNDKVAWSGDANSGTITIDTPNLFGGDDTSGAGGFQAQATLYSGDGTHSPDSYLTGVLGSVPAYKNDARIVFHGLVSGGAYIGNSPSFPEINVEVSRYPNQLAVTSGKHIIDTYDANPVCALYEFLTRSEAEFGAGMSPLQFNLTNWRAVAAIVHDEGLGVSRMFDSATDVIETINDYLNLIDGVMNVNMQTGEFEITLARADYDVDDIPVLTDDDFVEITSFTRGSWVDTFNEVKMSYTDRTQSYESIPVAAQDVANAAGQGEVRQQTIAIEGVSNPTTANKIIWRELRPVSIPLGKLTGKINRKNYSLYGGAVFKWSSEKYGIEAMILRVSEVGDGRLNDGTMSVTCVQDVFSLGVTAFNSPTNEWEEPTTTAVAATDEVLVEQPRAFHGTDLTKVMSVVARPNGAQVSYNLYAKESTATDYIPRLTDNVFSPVGTLHSDYVSAVSGSSLTVDPGQDMDELPATVQPSDIRTSGEGLLLIGSEILAYESYAIVSGRYVFSNVWGGLLDTALTKHTAGASVYFLSEGIGMLTDTFTTNSTVNAKATPIGSDGELPIASATAFSKATQNRAARPIRPANLKVQTVVYGTSIPAIGNDINFEWYARSRDASLRVLKQSDASEAETDVTTTIKVYDGSGTLLATKSGLTGLTYTYTVADQTTDAANVGQLTFVVYSELDSVKSFQAIIHATARPASSPSTTLPTYTP